MGEREELLGWLIAAGIDAAEVERAAAEGWLPALALESVLGGGLREFSLTRVAKEAGLPTPFVRELMQALGRPNPAPRERAFSREDVDLARITGRFVDAGLPRGELLEVCRVLSQGMTQTADAVRRLVGNAMLEPGASEDRVALRYIDAAEHLGPLMAELLDAQFLAHLRAGISHQLVSEAERVAGRLSDSVDVAVAFVDLVEYTSLGTRLPPEDMGRIAGRLAELAVDTVRRPVTLVKTIGDAAMFVSPDADAIVAVIDRLVRRIAAEGPEFPAARAGIVFGRATARGGDWYGATVNLASRVTGLAKPGQILATEAVQGHTTSATWTRKYRRRKVKGIGQRVRLFTLDADPNGNQAASSGPPNGRPRQPVTTAR